MYPLQNDFKAKAPLATLQAGWFNTVANILNDITGVGCHIEKPGGGQGYGWQIVVDEAGGALSQYHFKVELESVSTVKVYGGNWKRHAHGVETSLNYAGESVEITGTTYLILKLDNNLAPAAISLDASATDAADDDNVVKVLAKCTLGTGDSIEIENYWTGGDITDFYLVPDNDEGTRKSLDYHVDTNCLQLYNFGNQTKDTALVVAGESGGEYLDYVTTAEVPKDCNLSLGVAGTIAKGLSRGDHEHKVPNTTVEAITSVRFDEASHKIQIKYTTLTILASDTEDTNWTDITEATACPTV